MKEPTTWGRWVFNRSAMTLDHDEGYDVDLERCNSSAEVLDWICQLAAKSWITTADLGNLVRALDDLLQPQATLCSWGVDKRMTVTEEMLREHEREAIAWRIIREARRARVADTPLGLPVGVSLGELIANEERAEEIVDANPDMPFADLVRTYQRASAVERDLAEAA